MGTMSTSDQQVSSYTHDRRIVSDSFPRQDAEQNHQCFCLDNSVDKQMSVLQASTQNKVKLH